jgi:hypothetical protein
LTAAQETGVFHDNWFLEMEIEIESGGSVDRVSSDFIYKFWGGLFREDKKKGKERSGRSLFFH